MNIEKNIKQIHLISHPFIRDVAGLTFAILLTFTHAGVGGGGVSGLGAISSSGATSGLSANMLSKSICEEKEGMC